MRGHWAVSSLVLLQIILVSGSGSAQGAAKRTAAQFHDARLKVAEPLKTAALRADPTLELRLTRKYTFSPGYVRSLVRVSPHPDNRLLRVTLDSADYYRSSDIELDGADAARSHFLNWTSLPAGHYDIVATLFGPDGPRGQSTDVLDVIGLGGRE